MFIMKNNRGFTLMEILVALFIFTILSMLMTTALRTVINAQSGSEDKAERLRKLQIALLIVSRDIEQAIDRPIVNSSGKEEAAFIGGNKGFALTHTGGASMHSALQRTGYSWNEDSLFRLTWPVLDQTPETKVRKRVLLNDVVEARFQYLDEEGHFRDAWPLEGETKQPLPRGVRIYLTFAHWGKMSQLYLIPVQPSKNLALPPQKKKTEPKE